MAYVDSVAKGYSDDDLRYVVGYGARHEAAWAYRFPQAVRFLLA